MIESLDNKPTANHVICISCQYADANQVAAKSDRSNYHVTVATRQQMIDFDVLHNVEPARSAN